MAKAREWADEGAPHGALVLAEEQTTGRGRRGRQWVSAYGKNLLMTLILKPDLPEKHLSLIPLLVGLAIAEACESLITRSARIKWPNDVLIEGRKVAGILVEQSRQNDVPLILLGIGLNVNQMDFDETEAPNPTSLALEFGSPVPRSQVLNALLHSLEQRLAVLERNVSTVVDDINQRLAFRGERVARIADEERVEGIVRDVSNDGSLRLETREGNVFIYAGDVERVATRSQ